MTAPGKLYTAMRLLRKVKFYFSPYKVFTKEDRRFRLGWRRLLCLMALFALMLWILDLEGRFDLGRPVLAGLGSIYIIVQLRWYLRNYIWFWATLIVFFTMYSFLIFAIKWDTEGPSRGIIGGLMGISVYLIFVILHAFESRRKQASAGAAQSAHHAGERHG